MIYVIGGCNIDINVKLDTKCRLKESNPCKVTKTYGGVSRNIAKAISLYNTCTYITAVPDTKEYRDAIKDLEDSGIDCSNVLYTDPSTSATYIDVIDENGLVVGACDMTAVECLTVDYLKSLKLETKDDDIIVCDTDFSKEILGYIVDNYKGLKVLEAVSSKKLERTREVLDKFDLIKGNLEEFEFIKDVKVKNRFITSGNVVGLLFKDYELIIKHKYLSLVSPNGCGDTLLGVFIALMDKGIEEALYKATIAGIASSQTKEAVPTKELIDSIDTKELDIKWIE